MKLGRDVRRHNELDNWRNTHRYESVMATIWLLLTISETDPGLWDRLLCDIYPGQLARTFMLTNYARWYSFTPPQWPTLSPPLTPIRLTPKRTVTDTVSAALPPQNPPTSRVWKPTPGSTHTPGYHLQPEDSSAAREEAPGIARLPKYLGDISPKPTSPTTPVGAAEDIPPS